MDSIEVKPGGQYNDVIIVNSSLLFRFPRYTESLNTLKRSTALLRALQGHLPLPVPNPVYAHLDTAEIGQAFAGYALLPGEAINIYSLESNYDSAVCQRLADQLADFLKALHSIPPQILPADIAINDDHAHYTDLYHRVREKLFPLMHPDAHQTIEHDFEAYLSDDRNFDFPRHLIHGDFGTGNILFDPETRTFTGVIDFDFAGLGDITYDLGAIYGFQGRGAAFAQRLFRRYPELEVAMPRVKFRVSTYLLYEALFGVENNEPELVESGLEPYH